MRPARETNDDNDHWKQAVQGDSVTIKFLDVQIGRLVEAVDRSQRADDPVIVFWSDHGWHLGEMQHWRKFALWEEAARAPLAIIAPGVTRLGSRCDAPVDFMRAGKGKAAADSAKILRSGYCREWRVGLDFQWLASPERGPIHRVPPLARE